MYKKKLDHNILIKNHSPLCFPLSGVEALERFRQDLTPYEQKEICNYSHVYFVGRREYKIDASIDCKSNNYGYDDNEGRYNLMKSDHIGFRFEILSGLGNGTYSDVIKAFDHKMNKQVAIKIIRNEKHFHKNTNHEIMILLHLKEQDIHNTYNIVHIDEHFMFRNHICITFELLDKDMYSVLKKYNFMGFSLIKVNIFCQNLLHILQILHKNHIIHCDLKPKNILLKQRNHTDIKIIDFGVSCFDYEKPSTYTQSRYYRSPEIILGTRYNFSIDMWSLGCILVELHTGKPLFPGQNERDQIVLIMEVINIPPHQFLLGG